MDENTRQCPGKKDTITRGKQKMQKRYLNDTLTNLHKKFILYDITHRELSYSEFCKLRPFWVVPPKRTERDTCLCKIHENVTLIVAKLHHLNIISEKNPEEVLKSLTCKGNMAEKCLEKNVMFASRVK